MPPPDRSIVLVGAGHAHLHVISNAHRLRELGGRVVVVDPSDLWYSGLATGMLGGMYEPADDRINVVQLANRHGVTLVRDRISANDPAERRMTLASGETLHYDIASINIGSETDQSKFSVADDSAWTVKPIANLVRLRRCFTARLADGDGEAIVIGGGATGCEIAANLAELARRQRQPVKVTLISRSARLIPEHPERASSSIKRALEDRGIRLMTVCAAERIEPSAVHCSDLSIYRARTIVLATGLRPPAVVRRLGLAYTDAGLQVDSTLRCVSDAQVFGAGDCIDFTGRSLPKLGVFGVRQAPILLRNLCRTLAGQALCEYRPQRRWLTILNLGRGEAMAIRGKCWWRGRLAMRLKDHLDRRFLNQYRTQTGAAGQ